MKILRTLCGAFAGLCLLAVSVAKADIISYNLDNSNGFGYPGPFGTVQVDLTDPIHATITFTSDVVSGNIYLFGGAQSVDVNVNAASWSIGPIVGSNAGTGFTTPILSDGGSQNVDGRGTFNQTIDGFDGFMHSADTVTFTLTDTSGIWAGASSVLETNNNGNFVAAHIFVTSYPANQANGAFVTGYGGGDTPNTPSVPDGGSTIILFGSAMMGLGSLRVWFGRK